ncbi:MAG: hypothetical protein SOX11_03265 [Lachnospiraceae bacterium]|nr:hypothetical protein [Lachnospiraceae bacterium]MDY3222146.1 hypothetical protein [Lachnospiraceae bacterium]
MEDKAVLQTIENNREIIWDSDSEFLFEYQKAMLLALKELGTLDEMQYRYAEETLKEQLRRIVKKKLSCNTATGGDAND